MFSESESDYDSSEDINQLTVNDHYEKAFNARKEREELMKLKEKLGSDAEEGDEGGAEDSESDELEDEEGEELTPATDVAILRTLAKIKRKDPSIYNKDEQIFEKEQSRQTTTKAVSKTSTKESKPVKMKDMVLDSMLHSGSRSVTPEPAPLTHNQEQAALRNETVSAFHEAVSDEEGDDLLVPREKAKDELEREEEEYAEFLRREVGEDLGGLVDIEPMDVHASAHDAESLQGAPSGPPSSKTKKKKAKGAVDSTKSKEDQDQEFLMNYILNRGWIDKTKKRVPTYKEVTSGSVAEVEVDELEVEDQFDDMADEFETSYNFRFEEPNADTISRFPRSIPSAVRRPDTARIEARQRRNERKDQEKLQRKEEVKRMKALKFKEQKEKLDKIGKEGGIELGDEDLDEIDLDGDWDPDKHDQQMSKLYESGKATVDEKKPNWEDDLEVDDLELEDESRNRKKKRRKEKEVSQYEGGVDVDMMDANVERNWDEEWDGTEEMRKQKLDEYMEELYKMEFNDLVGNMPTRFNYVPVAAETFNLNPAEILLADDKDLNEFISLKKIAPYRKEKRVKWDQKRNEKLKEFRSRLKERGKIWKQNEAERSSGDLAAKKKRMGKKERRKLKEGAQLLEGQD